MWARTTTLLWRCRPHQRRAVSPGSPPGCPPPSRTRSHSRSEPAGRSSATFSVLCPTDGPAVRDSLTRPHSDQISSAGCRRSWRTGQLPERRQVGSAQRKLLVSNTIGDGKPAEPPPNLVEGALMPALSEVVSLHGHELRYLAAGSGPAILFVHGLMSSSGTWSNQIERLGAGHRVIAPDLFGHGASAKPAGDYSLGAHAATLRDLLDALAVPSATVVGHSLGGGIALQFAYLFPDRIDRLVLVSSGGLGRELNPLLRAATLPGSELVLPA